jgi:hypothetical protein
MWDKTMEDEGKEVRGTKQWRMRERRMWDKGMEDEGKEGVCWTKEWRMRERRRRDVV